NGAIALAGCDQFYDGSHRHCLQSLKILWPPNIAPTIRYPGRPVQHSQQRRYACEAKEHNNPKTTATHDRAEVLTLRRMNLILRDSIERGEGSRHGHENHYGVSTGRSRRASLGGCPPVAGAGRVERGRLSVAHGPYQRPGGVDRRTHRGSAAAHR